MGQIQIDRLDGLSSSTAIKGPCRVATTADIDLRDLQTIDGVAVQEGDRVLVRAQSDARENGIYVASTGLWRRVKDFSSNRDIRQGGQVLVAQGDVQARTLWGVVTPDPIVIGETALEFEQVIVSAAQLEGLVEAATEAKEAAQDAAARSEEYAADAALKGSSIYETVSGMATTPVPNDVHTIQVNWDDVLGDGGTGRYIDTDNGSPVAFTSAAGTGATARDWYRAADVSTDRLLSEHRHPFGLTGLRMLIPEREFHVGFTSAILDVGNGKWIIIYREASYHGVVESKIMAVDTYDKGVTLKNKRQIYTLAGYDTRNFTPCQLANGRIGILAIRRQVANPSLYETGIFIGSDDGGDTWFTNTFDDAAANGFNYNFNSSVIPFPANIGGHDTFGFMAFAYGGSGARVRTVNNGTSWEVDTGLFSTDARFTAMSESVVWCVAPNKYVAVMRVADTDPLPINFCSHVSTDALNWSGPFDSGLVMNARGPQGNPPGQVGGYFGADDPGDGLVHFLTFSRRGREIRPEWSHHLLSATADGEALFAANGDFSALDVDWSVVASVPDWAGGSIMTSKIDGRWYGTFNCGEDLYPHTTSMLCMVGDFLATAGDISRVADELFETALGHMFKATKDGSTHQTIPASTATKVTFPVTQINAGDMYNGANSRVVLKKSGPVHLMAQTYITTGEDGINANIEIRKTPLATGVPTPIATKIHRMSGTGGMALDISVDDLGYKGDMYEVFVNIGSSTPKTVFAAPTQTYFTGHMIR